MTTELLSKRYAVDDPGQAIELCFEKGWTDGLPVVPPTESRVCAMLDAVGLPPRPPGHEHQPTGRWR
jgi:hypothetical protein